MTAAKPPYSPSGEGPETAENVTYHRAAEAILDCPGEEGDRNLCRCECLGCKYHCGAHDPSRLWDDRYNPEQAAASSPAGDDRA